MLGSQATPEEVEQLREQLGLNLPLYDSLQIGFSDFYKEILDGPFIIIDQF